MTPKSIQELVIAEDEVPMVEEVQTKEVEVDIQEVVEVPFGLIVEDLSANFMVELVTQGGNSSTVLIIAFKILIILLHRNFLLHQRPFIILRLVWQLQLL